MMQNNWVCNKCNAQMEVRETSFEYMRLSFSMPLPRCPICGLVYISEEIAKEKLAKVEIELEEK